MKIKSTEELVRVIQEEVPAMVSDMAEACAEMGEELTSEEVLSMTLDRIYDRIDRDFDYDTPKVRKAALKAVAYYV